MARLLAGRKIMTVVERSMSAIRRLRVYTLRLRLGAMGFGWG